jgi:2-oxoglutarate dehydrogenase E1 component
MDGRPVRLAGQDSRRGTFVSRFATIIDRNNADEWTPLSNLTEEQAKFHVYDSLLSEYAALGFEYGYSVARPDALVLWEAQFGEFVNGAQIVIDEFISSGKTKWQQESGVVLLLPHGYEGQGSDHSSARIERFMTMCADDAFVVAQPSTPASYFHLLRRHSLGQEHRPLIVFTPKSMLKRKEAASQPSDFVNGTFRPFIGDATADAQKVDTLLLCSGRVTWDLMVERTKQENAERFAIGRVEQLYPRPLDDIKHAQRVAARRRQGRGGRSRRVLHACGRHREAAHRGAEGPHGAGLRVTAVYFTDRGIEELAQRRGDEEVSLAWLADRLSEFTDGHPEFETAVERLATWLARLDDPDD